MAETPGAVAGKAKQYYVAVGSPDAKLPTLVELLHALQQDSPLAVALCCSSRDSLDEVVCALAGCSDFSLAVLHSDLPLEEMRMQVLALKARLQQRLGSADASGAAGPRDAGAGGTSPRDAAAGAGAPPAAPALRHHHHHHQQQQQQQHQRPPPAGDPDGVVARRTGGSPEGGGDARALVLATTDVCLKALGREVLPVGLPLLIQFDIPTTKEQYLRRLAAVFGASRERRRGPRSPVIVDFVVAGEIGAFRARQRFSSAGINALPVHVPDIFVT